MKSCLFLFVYLATVYTGFSQEEEWIRVQEDQAFFEVGQEVEGDLEHLDYWRRKKISINKIDLSDLSIFPFITSLQAVQFVQYRKLLGDFIDIMELQAIPGWDGETVRKLIPYVTMDEVDFIKKRILGSFLKGAHQVLIRSSIKESTGYLARYQFRSPYLQGGVQVEKDPGEKLLQRGKGVSFLSGQISLSKIGMLRQLVIGDFNISMAQGLLLGLGRVVHKSGMPIMIKRQQPFLSPYRSTDENRYFRGIGCWLTRSNWELGGFVSSNRLDGNVKSDTLLGEFISSFQTSGLHKTASELADKNSLGLRSFGMMGSLSIKKVKIGIQGVNHFFSLPILRSDDLYNKYAINGKKAGGLGFFAETSLRNMHLFGEWSRNNEGQQAGIIGIELAVDRRLDVSLLYRNIAKGYRAFWASSFTESTEPADEKGMYVGISFRPLGVVQLDAYADFYKSDWLKYQINAPVSGTDQLLMVQVKPDKNTLFYVRYKAEQKTDGISHELQPIQLIGSRRSNSFRFHMEKKLSGTWTWRNRVEWGNQVSAGGTQSRGTVIFTEWFWKNFQKPYSINGRIMFCETDNFDSRLYAYENDVMYYGLITAFYGKFLRFNGNVNVEVTKQLGFQIKLSQNIPVQKASTVLRVQFIWRT